MSDGLSEKHGRKNVLRGGVESRKLSDYNAMVDEVYKTWRENGDTPINDPEKAKVILGVIEGAKKKVAVWKKIDRGRKSEVTDEDLGVFGFDVGKLRMGWLVPAGGRARRPVE